jgi:hypothetical protein
MLTEAQKLLANQLTLVSDRITTISSLCEDNPEITKSADLVNTVIRFNLNHPTPGDDPYNTDCIALLTLTYIKKILSNSRLSANISKITMQLYSFTNLFLEIPSLPADIQDEFTQIKNAFIKTQLPFENSFKNAEEIKKETESKMDIGVQVTLHFSGSKISEIETNVPKVGLQPFS